MHPAQALELHNALRARRTHAANFAAERALAEAAQRAWLARASDEEIQAELARRGAAELEAAARALLDKAAAAADGGEACAEPGACEAKVHQFVAAARAAGDRNGHAGATNAQGDPQAAAKAAGMRTDVADTDGAVRARRQRQPPPASRLVLYPGERHGLRRFAARLDFALRQMRWFGHYLGAGGAGAGGEEDELRRRGQAPPPPGIASYRRKK